MSVHWNGIIVIKLASVKVVEKKGYKLKVHELICFSSHLYVIFNMLKNK